LCDQAELCSHVEEAMCLRAMISQLREQLEAEKRVNAAIKQKKVRSTKITLRDLFAGRH